jgi:hypothetical protein
MSGSEEQVGPSSWRAVLRLPNATATYTDSENLTQIWLADLQESVLCRKAGYVIDFQDVYIISVISTSMSLYAKEL